MYFLVTGKHVNIWSWRSSYHDARNICSIVTIVLNQCITQPCEGVKNIVIDEQPYSRVLRFDFSEIFSSLSFAFRKIGSAKSIHS